MHFSHVPLVVSTLFCWCVNACVLRAGLDARHARLGALVAMLLRLDRHSRLTPMWYVSLPCGMRVPGSVLRCSHGDARSAGGRAVGRKHRTSAVAVTGRSLRGHKGMPNTRGVLVSTLTMDGHLMARLCCIVQTTEHLDSAFLSHSVPNEDVRCPYHAPPVPNLTLPLFRGCRCSPTVHRTMLPAHCTVQNDREHTRRGRREQAS